MKKTKPQKMPYYPLVTPSLNIRNYSTFDLGSINLKFSLLISTFISTFYKVEEEVPF